MELTTTSYLILGMLTSRDFSAYEIAEQVSRGLTQVWPRADRQLYSAPKQLVERGLATATYTQNGMRRRTVYSITDEGRVALTAWLATAAKPPAMEFEGMIRVLLADQGSVKDLRSTLSAIRDQATGALEMFAAHERLIEQTGGTYPEKQHLFALSSPFMRGHFENLANWATWALAETDGWKSTNPATRHRLIH